MTADELKAIRNQLHLTQSQFAGELGYGGSPRNNAGQIEDYESGEKTIPAYIARLAYMLLEHFNAEDSHLPEWPPSCAHLPPKPNGGKRDERFSDRKGSRAKGLPLRHRR